MRRPAANKNKEFVVLLVEDSADDYALITRAFDDSDVVPCVHRVEDGEQCLQFLRKEGAYSAAPTPDLVLLDLGMPQHDGIEVLRQIRDDADNRLLPVVILTGSTSPEHIRECYRLRVNSYLRKPGDYDAFQQLINSFVDFWMNVATLPTGKSGESRALH